MSTVELVYEVEGIYYVLRVVVQCRVSPPMRRAHTHRDGGCGLVQLSLCATKPSIDPTLNNLI